MHIAPLRNGDMVAALGIAAYFCLLVVPFNDFRDFLSGKYAHVSNIIYLCNFVKYFGKRVGVSLHIFFT